MVVLDSTESLFCLLHAVCPSDVLALSCGEGDDLLALGGPGDSTAVDEERVACYGVSVLSHAAIRVGIALEGSLGRQLDYTLFCLCIPGERY